ncbi:uncharacterized protein LOC133037684 [Cannabis sativa]|uniref:uncharacterized protein LOC133037684 n=1 Tax=Cannabis sativa TaxID=3483 RepID=UPI0029CA921D|nr:uncharacterized protein LOC133037684 [Cannabis sativa]
MMENPNKEMLAQNKALMSDILSRLPVRSLLKCKTVNKFWKSLIENKYFVSVLHLDRAPYLHFQPVNQNSYIIDSFCGLVLKMSNQNPVNYSIVNPATRQILDLPDPNHAILRSPYVDNHAPAIQLLPLIAFNRKTHECKLLLECRRVNNQGVEEHALETFEVGKDINWRSIGRQTGFLHFPDVIKLMYVRTSGELHSVRVLLTDEGIALSVLSINAWDDMYLVNNGLPRDVHFNLLKACFIEWDDCLAIAEIIGLDLHLLKMTKYDGGDLRWSEQKRIVPLTFLNTEPYSKERDQISPAIFQSTVLWFNFRRRMSFSYDVKAKRINKIELPRPKRELFDTDTKFQHFPSLVKLQGMRPDQGNYQWYEDRM